jgi:DNA polymerase-3 subunit gamma/tau
VVQALAHALDRDRLHPAILLTGTRGVGKTTLGRIIAKGLNCETGVTSNPCGQCASCREIDEGRFVDLLEIDAASRTKVDDTRQLLDNVQYSPVRGRYKVYLIDEVHMLSNSSFNALLKTLEEPPPHVKFILATTDPQKLPVTVLSRCLQFSLKRLPVALIRETLAEVLKQEGVDFEPGVVAEIARAADGSMRDGLSLLDQAIAFAGGGKLLAEAVEEMIGTVGRRTLLDLLQALARQDAAGVLAGIERLDAQAPDYSALLNDLAAKLQRVAVLQTLPDAKDEDEESVILELAGTMTPEDVQLYYQIAVLGRRDLPWAPDPRLGFEMTLLRMLAFRPDAGAPPAAAAGGRGSAPSRAPAAAGASAAPVAAPSVARAGTAASVPVARAAEPAQRSAFNGTASPVQHAVEEPKPTTNGGAASPQTSVLTSEASAWSQRIESLNFDALVRQLARHCAWVGERDGAVQLQLEYATRHLLNEDRRAAIERALKLRVSIEVAAEGAVIDSPTQQDRLRAEQRQQAAETTFENDPTVQDFRRMFGATVRPGSVQPTGAAE